MKKISLIFIYLTIISCSKKNAAEDEVILATYQLSILDSEGGSVNYDNPNNGLFETCLLYTSDAADE